MNVSIAETTLSSYLEKITYCNQCKSTIDTCLSCKKAVTRDERREVLNIIAGAMFQGNNYKACVTARTLEEMGFLDVPASIKYHGNYEGGLFDHSALVTKEILRISRLTGIKWEREESPVIIGMLHDIGKVENYTKGEDGWNYNDRSMMPGHGEKSMWMACKMLAGGTTTEEDMCIRWHMGAFDDKEKWRFYNAAVKKYPNILYTHTADMIASQVMGI